MKYPYSMRQMQYEHIVGLIEQNAAMDCLNLRGARYGMDVNHPLVDRRLGEFTLAAPLHLGARPGSINTKWILRQAVENVLPNKIRLRSGKGNPDARSETQMRFQYRRFMRELFTESLMARCGLIDGRGLLEAFDGYCSFSKSDISHFEFFSAMLLEWWLRTHCKCGNIQFSDLQPWQTE